jgi:hypothetical protein
MSMQVSKTLKYVNEMINHPLNSHQKSIALLHGDSVLGVIMELNGSGARYGFSDREIHQTMLNFDFGSFRYDPFERQLTAIELAEVVGVRNVLYLQNLEVVRSRLASADKLAIHGLYI